MKDLSFAIKLYKQDTKDLQKQLVILHQYYGSMVHLQDYQRAQAYIHYYMADILQYLEDMLDYMSVLNI